MQHTTLGVMRWLQSIRATTNASARKMKTSTNLRTFKLLPSRREEKAPSDSIWKGRGVVIVWATGVSEFALVSHHRGPRRPSPFVVTRLRCPSTSTMESLNLNMLASSLPNSNLANAEKDLMNNFKGHPVYCLTIFPHPDHSSSQPPPSR